MSQTHFLSARRRRVGKNRKQAYHQNSQNSWMKEHLRLSISADCLCLWQTKRNLQYSLTSLCFREISNICTTASNIEVSLSCEGLISKQTSRPMSVKCMCTCPLIHCRPYLQLFSSEVNSYNARVGSKVLGGEMQLWVLWEFYLCEDCVISFWDGFIAFLVFSCFRKEKNRERKRKRASANKEKY